MVHDYQQQMHTQERPVECPGCHAASVFSFCELEDVPVDVGRVESTAEKARQVRRGDIQLCYCTRCGLVHNSRFDSSRISFEPGYEVALHHSPIFRDFVTGVADRLVEKYDLHRRRILDIGCGGGYFLETICRAGGNSGIGIDPTVGRVGTHDAGEGTVTFVRDFWSEKHRDLIGDFITCQSVFEDIAAPLAFLRQLRSMLEGNRPPLYFEVFNGYRAFEHQETWSIHYEQCNYFSLDCLKHIFELAGFEVTASGHCYQGDQYLYVEAIPGDAQAVGQFGEVPAAIAEFSQLHAKCVAQWSRQLTDWREAQKRVVMWGSGGKGVNFLNSIDASQAISHVVDINPDRQGKFIPGSGQLIVAPDFLRDFRPDYVILTNPIYQDEIVKQMRDLGVDCQVRLA